MISWGWYDHKKIVDNNKMNKIHSKSCKNVEVGGKVEASVQVWEQEAVQANGGDFSVLKPI